MAYINSKLTRIYVHADVEEAGAPPADGASATMTGAGWVLARGARSDQAQATPNTQDTFHYGEESAVSTASPPSRTITVPASEDLADPGQRILRWAAATSNPIAVAIIKDGTNGYAVPASVVVNDESGDAAGGLRATGFTITPQGERAYIGDSGLYVPG